MKKKKYNNMNFNYDCDESPSLSSKDCLMKDVTCSPNLFMNNACNDCV